MLSLVTERQGESQQATEEGGYRQSCLVSCPLLGQVLLEAAKEPGGNRSTQGIGDRSGNLRPCGKNAGMCGGAHGTAPMPQPCPGSWFRWNLVRALVFVNNCPGDYVSNQPQCFMELKGPGQV